MNRRNTVEAWGTSMVTMASGTPIDYEVETTMIRMAEYPARSNLETQPFKGCITFNGKTKKEIIEAGLPVRPGIVSIRRDHYSGPEGKAKNPA